VIYPNSKEMELINAVYVALASTGVDRVSHEVSKVFDEKLANIKEWEDSNIAVLGKEYDKYISDSECKPHLSYVPQEFSDEAFHAYFELNGAEGIQVGITEQLHAIEEMKIICKYRKVELFLNAVIKLLNGCEFGERFFIARELKEVLSSVGIEIGVMKRYQDYNGLRLVNNSIKHSNKISREVKALNIKFFKGLEYFTYYSLCCFYENNSVQIDLFVKAVALKAGGLIDASPEVMTRFEESDCIDELPF